MSIQGWAVAAVLALAGYAWHDALGGRLPRAGRWALLGLLALGALFALLNVGAEYAAFALAAAPALGWSLRRPRAAPLPALPDVAAGLAYAALAALVAFAWSPALVVWGFIVGAVLVALRVALLDPLLAWRASRGRKGEGDEEPETPNAESANG